MSKDSIGGDKPSDYIPLFVLIAVAFLAGVALTLGGSGGTYEWMHYFMGFFFCQFAMLKLFDVEGFANGFQMYDLLAKKSRQYALAYPLVELGLGLAYLSFFIPVLTYLVTIGLMSVGAYGVFQAMQNKLDVKCACMGTTLNVPLSTVTLTEDLGMGIMAFILLIMAV